MSFVKQVGLIIDLHQSPTQEESIFKQAVNDLYIPLIRLIKSKKDMKITLSVPLSTLELLDKYGFEDQINDLKELYSSEKIDLVGSSAYGSLLDSLPNDAIENQIIYNEYSLGYYLGSRQGFEGESSILIKDLQGFVPSYFYINSQILKLVEGLGYNWVLTSEDCLPKKYKETSSCVYKMVGSEVNIVRVDEETRNIISSYKDRNISDLKKEITNKLKSEWGIKILYVKELRGGLDAEMYKKEFELLDVLIELLEEQEIGVVSVTDVIKKTTAQELNPKEHVGYVENSSKKDGDMLSYYFTNSDQQIKELKQSETTLCNIKLSFNDNSDLVDLLTLPIWKNNSNIGVNDSYLQDYICYFTSLSKFMCFDKYLYQKLCTNTEEVDDRACSRLHIYSQFAEISLKFLTHLSSIKGTNLNSNS